MIGEDFRFEGFDTRSWLNLASLFQGALGSAERAPELSAAPRPKGTLVIVTDAADRPLAAFMTERGAIDVNELADLHALDRVCERLGAARAIALREHTVEEWTERAGERLAFDIDYVAQWLTLLAIARELEDEGLLRFWPPRPRVPLPTIGMLQRVLDLLLPDRHVLLVALWENQELWTAIAVRRRGDDIDRVVGPELLLEWTGPLGGDYRRDQRALQRAVTRVLGPVYIGLFAQRQRVERLLRDPRPGAWAQAIALREVIINPAPPYVHMAMGADAARAAAQHAREWLGGLDLLSYLVPAARFARAHVTRVGSVTGILGFNPLRALAERLRRNRSSDEAAAQTGPPPKTP